MQVDGHTGNGILDGGNQIVGFLGAHDTGHVLDADGGSAHFLQLLDHLHIVGLGVNRRGGIRNGTGSNGTGVDGGLHGNLQVVHVVQSVKNTDDVDTVFHGLLDEELYEIVGVVGVAQNILTPQQHLQLGVGYGSADLAQTLPGIFVQVAQADVEGGAAPAFDGIVASLVDGRKHGLELLIRQAGCDQRLICITQHGLHKLNFLSHCVCYLRRKNVIDESERQIESCFW